MYTRQIVFCLALALTANASQARDVLQTQAPSSTPSVLNAKTSAMPLPFTKNEGQWPDSILFRAGASGVTMWFTKNGIYYQFFRRISRADSAGFTAGMPEALRLPGHEFERDSIETTMIKAEFVGASESVEVVGLEVLEYKCNYFIGNEPSKWRSDVPNYSAVTMRDLYPGVDVTFSSKDGRLQEDLSASTSGDLSHVKIAYRGAEGVTQQTDNRSVVQTPFGERLFEGVLLSSGQESSLSESRSSATGSSSASAVTLIYSTHLGGGGQGVEGQNDAYGIAVDANGNVFVTGYTASVDFPTLNPYQVDQGSFDVIVTKLSSSGSALIYSTYLGGGSIDAGWSIAVDANSNAFVTGITYSSDFPTLNPFQTDQGGTDVFVAKLSSSGSILIYSTYLGGASDEEIYEYGGIAIDASGNAFVTGLTLSANFPTINPYQTYQGGGDVFVTKLSSIGSSLIYSTYLGGGGQDEGRSIVVDASGNAYVTGYTGSSNFPAVNPYQMDQAGDDVFVTKLSSTGSALIYSTYLGGGSGDYGFGITIDASGSAFVTGETHSSDFPTLNSFQTDQSNTDVFVTKLSNSGSALIYSTYLGGGNNEYGQGIAVDSSGNAFVTGATYSADFPTLNSYQSTAQGINDVFVAKFSSSGDGLIYSTYLGGSSEDRARGIAVDVDGDASVTGYTGSSNFPTLNAYQGTFQGGNFDAFVTKIAAYGSSSISNLSADGTPSIQNIMANSPTFRWSEISLPDLPQTQFEIAIGTDNNWTLSEMWNPSPFNSPDTFVNYGGSPLLDGQTYWLRLRVNNGLVWSDWFETTFRMNSVPTAPVCFAPTNDALANSVSPPLSLLNSTDAETDPIHYIYHVYTDVGLSNLVAFDSAVALTPNTTGWNVSPALNENQHYFWRAKASDGFEYSNWSTAASFFVNATNSAPTTATLIDPDEGERVFDMLPSFHWSKSTDEDPADTVRYTLKVALTAGFAFVTTKDSILDTTFLWQDSLSFGTHYYWKVEARDKNGGLTVSATQSFPTWVLGDADGSGEVSIGDAVFLINYIFNGGAAPDPLKAGDMDASCDVNIGDVIYLIARIFLGGPAPLVGC